MPPKKEKKTKEEKTAENFFPVEENDLKYTVKKPYRKADGKSLEKVLVKKTTRKKKGKSTRTKTAEFRPQKINLKKNGYELIITEKPQAASKISAALGKPSAKRDGSGISYYELDREGQKIVVACAVGHLLSLSQNVPGTEVPMFDVSWKPNYLVRKGDFTKKYFDTVSRLAKNAGSITIATDYDVEGEVIGLNVMRYVCGQDDASRMKFSTLTVKELNRAYEEKSGSINWGQAIAGETRHYLDWFYGINLSRALMNAIKSAGSFRIMSVGRVQGPALQLIVEKERGIRAFKPKDYWQVFITVKNSHEIELMHNKDVFKESELEKFEKLKGRKTVAETQKKEQIVPPPFPFDLTTLQTETYKFHGLSPSRTLQAAQSLYLAGLISYPRTSSQKLPASINYAEILKKLAEKYDVSSLMKREKPVEGKKSDPAHPSIYPTGNTQILSGDEEKVYNLIVRRFLSLFCEDAVIDGKKISVREDDLLFSVRGMSIRKKAWMSVYPVKMKENEIPDLNGKVEITKVRNEKKQTQPPRRYTQASILSELEKRNLGTKATRASILETLYNRGYVKEKSMEATPLGMSLIETLEKHSPIIIDEELTRNFEKDMESIAESKKDFREKENKVMEKAKKSITTISEEFRKDEKEIGRELTEANKNLREQEKKENTLNACPKCREGNLVITYSKKTRRNFVACDKFPDCRNTFSLPPDGVAKKTDKNCEKCNFPVLLSLRKGKRPWFFCFNPECETNRERIEEYRKKKQANLNQA